VTGSPTFRNCVFRANSALNSYTVGSPIRAGRRACIWLRQAAHARRLHIHRNTLGSGSSSSWRGGAGVYAEMFSSPVLINCRFHGNAAGSALFAAEACTELRQRYADGLCVHRKYDGF